MSIVVQRCEIAYNVSLVYIRCGKMYCLFKNSTYRSFLICYRFIDFLYLGKSLYGAEIIFNNLCAAMLRSILPHNNRLEFQIANEDSVQEECNIRAQCINARTITHDIVCRFFYSCKDIFPEVFISTKLSP